MPFSTLGLDPNILKAIADAGYIEPTPIQLAAIPPILAGQDLIGIAQTGTGKTAAFVLPILAKLARSERNGVEPALSGPAHLPAQRGHQSPRKIRALVIAPTR